MRPRGPGEDAFVAGAVALGAAREQVLAAAERELIELAVTIASAIIEREVAIDPALQGTLARAALEAIGDAGNATLRASEQAHDAIVAALGGSHVVADGVHVEIKRDATLQGLGCVLDSDSVRVEGRVTERLRAVLRALLDEHRRDVTEAGE